MRQLRCLLALAVVAAVAAAATSAPAHASGTSPYLPLNLSPDIERKVEQVLILGDQAVMTRPVPISRVLTALPKACQRDEKLCEQVRRYLDRYFNTLAVTHAAGDVAASDGSSSQCHQTCTPGSASLQLPNEHGERIDSPWDASLVASYRPFDHLLFSAGGNAFGGPGGRFDPEGTMVSTGDQYLQFDAGYRDQWLSPMTDSSMLISTEAPTMPSLTVSSQMPFTPLGLEYQFSLARMSYQDNIAWVVDNKQGQLVNGGYTAGDPNLATLHLGITPLPGWSFAGNMLLQYGGGARPSSLGGLFDYLLQRTSLPNTCAPNAPPGTCTSSSINNRFANREVSLTSTYTFAGATPLETYVEYDGRDTLHGELYRFHETALSAGVHIPELFEHYDLTLEASEWQNNWYTDYVWQSGMVNDGSVIGDWGAAWREFSDAAGARSLMAQLGFSLYSGDLLDLQLRLLQNAGYASVCQAECGTPLRSYSPAQMLTVEYSQPRNGYTRGLTLDVGRDEYAAGFVRLEAFVRLDGGRDASAQDDEDEDNADDSGTQQSSAKSPAGFERYVGLGASTGRLGLDQGGFGKYETAPLQYRSELSPDLGVGLRRPISTYFDIGVQADFDNFDGLMMGLRILDLRYRVGTHVAIGGFVGMARYSAPTPAQGYYYGYGLQWRNLWRHWDVSLEERYYDALQRDKVLPSDAAALTNGDPVEWYMMQATSLTISHDF